MVAEGFDALAEILNYTCQNLPELARLEALVIGCE